MCISPREDPTEPTIQGVEEIFLEGDRKGDSENFILFEIIEEEDLRNSGP